MRQFVPGLALAFVASLAACTAAPPPPVDMRPEAETAIRAADTAAAAAAAAGDLDAIMAFSMADAVVLPPNEPLVSGTSDIRALWERNLAVPGFKVTWAPTTVVASSSGDLGYSIGTATISVNGPDGAPVTSEEKYLTIWRKDGSGAWKMAVDMFNSNAAPPPAGAGS